MIFQKYIMTQNHSIMWWCIKYQWNLAVVVFCESCCDQVACEGRTVWWQFALRDANRHNGHAPVKSEGRSTNKNRPTHDGYMGRTVYFPSHVGKYIMDPVGKIPNEQKNTSWWLNHPCEKYARQIGSFPKISGKTKLKPPPRHLEPRTVFS